MRKERLLFIFPLVALLLLVAPACKRSAVEEPNPFGPASSYMTFEVSASPNVVLTSDIREPVEVRALIKYGGLPAENQLVVFTIQDGPGEFDNYSTRTTAVTNQNGYAIVIYLSPLRSEIAFDQTVTFYIHPQTSSPYFTWKTIWIRLLRG
ncbi:MAG: hypothetical protein A2Y69_10775 [Candidatus Aminicenantes bacterium RBG_13_59_9]|nr:MAG: hypothetical protein A2Y69_10775 [Candidatus Aminicenantes bacterium RBG_13_59_9]